jgi:hypothetical protein
MLRPELQDLRVFVDGVDNIISTQKRVAQLYFDDGVSTRRVLRLKRCCT